MKLSRSALAEIIDASPAHGCGCCTNENPSAEQYGFARNNGLEERALYLADEILTAEAEANK